VETLAIRFGGTNKVPASSVPDFSPGVVSTPTGPGMDSSNTGGNSDGTAGIDEHDRETGAGCHALGDGFFGALIGTEAFGVVADVVVFEEGFVEEESGFTGRFDAFDKWEIFL